MRIAFVTNLPSHFHLPLFEEIAAHYDTEFYFFSDGGEEWIEKKNELTMGTFRGEYVPGISLTSKLRINIGIVKRLFRRRPRVIIHSINGRGELLVNFLFAKVFGIPFLLWTNLWFHPRTWFHRLTLPITKLVYRHSDALIVYGFHVSRYLEQLGVEKAKIFFCWNITDNNKFNRQVSHEEITTLRKRLDIHGKILLFVGRHSEEKGLGYLIETFERLGKSIESTLIMIGEGVEKPRLEALVRSRGIHNVRFLEYVRNDQLAQYYALADVFVLPSVTTATLKEVWGIVINEAMNQGCPIVATEAVGAAVGGLVIHGENGLVVPERDSEALEHALLDILTNDPMREAMRTRNRKKIAEWNQQMSFAGFDDAIRYTIGKRNEAAQPES